MPWIGVGSLFLTRNKLRDRDIKVTCRNRTDLLNPYSTRTVILEKRLDRRYINISIVKRDKSFEPHNVFNNGADIIMRF